MGATGQLVIQKMLEGRHVVKEMMRSSVNTDRVGSTWRFLWLSYYLGEAYGKRGKKEKRSFHTSEKEIKEPAAL